MKFRCLLLFAVVVLASVAFGETSERDSLSSKTRLSQAVFPFYERGHAQAIAVIRADRVFTEHERKGFFRIGLLPVRVAEEATIEIRDKERTSQALQQLDGWMKAPGGGRALELRNVSFKGPFGTALLKASRVRLGNAGQWRLLDAELSLSTGEVQRFAELRLQMTGSNAGELIAERSLPNLFQLLFPPAL